MKIWKQMDKKNALDIISKYIQTVMEELKLGLMKSSSEGKNSNWLECVRLIENCLKDWKCNDKWQWRVGIYVQCGLI